MPAEATAQPISNFSVLFRSGGAPLLALGLLLAVIGFVIVLRPRQRGVVVCYAAVSLAPGFLAMALVYAACTDFMAMATSPSAPRPSEFADATGRAMSFSFFGLAATLLPVTLAIIAFLRVPMSSAESESSDTAMTDPSAGGS